MNFVSDLAVCCAPVKIAQRRMVSSGATSSMREACVTGTPYTPNLGMDPWLTAVIVRPQPTVI